MLSGTERRLVDRVGGYLLNPGRRTGVTCDVCTTPIDGGLLCRRCSDDRTAFGNDLADLVVPVAYGGHNDQSKTLLYGYKTEPAARPGDERRDVILLLLWVAVHRHRRCLERRAGRPLDVWATVPSTKGRLNHPLLVIARRAGLGRHELDVETTPEQPPDQRVTARGRFTLGGPEASDRHVLIVDDTWTTGGRAQSLALTVRDAGAGLVTVVVLARWLDPQWPTTATYLSAQPRRDYDPGICPVTGGTCP